MFNFLKRKNKSKSIEVVQQEASSKKSIKSKNDVFSRVLNLQNMSEKEAKREASMIYADLVNFCLNKYGPVDKDYDENPTKRGKEWLDIHHVCEDELDDIARRTTAAQKAKDAKMLKALKKYNLASKLIYASKVEHYCLHYVIEYIRPGIGGGPHFCFGNILWMEIGYYKQDSYLADINRHIDKYYKDFSFEDVQTTYKHLMKMEKLTLKNVFPFWMIKSNNFDKEKLKVALEPIFK